MILNPEEYIVAQEKTLSRRTQMFHPEGDFDDAAVLAGLIFAKRLSPELVKDQLYSQGNRIGTAAARILRDGSVSKVDWDNYHQLWYRFKVPFGVASLWWWYLACLSRGCTTNSIEAGVWFHSSLEAFERSSPGDRPCLMAELAGVNFNGTIVGIHHDLSDVSALLTAAITAQPLIRMSSEVDAPTLVNNGIRIVWTEKDKSFFASSAIQQSLDDLCGSIPLACGELYHEALNHWNTLQNDERTLLLVTLEQKLLALEQVRLIISDQMVDNEGVGHLLAQCRSLEPCTWSLNHLLVATTALLWSEAGFVLQELNQAEMSLPLLKIFMVRKIVEYADSLDFKLITTQGLIPLAHTVGQVRCKVERTHLRCLHFDGSNLERREFLIPKSTLNLHLHAPASLANRLSELFGIPFPQNEATAAWKDYLDELIQHGHTPTELLIALAEWAVQAEDLPVDFAIFTVPMGIKLDRPWTLDLDDVFCYTAIRDGFDPPSAGLPLDYTGIRNAIGQRMRYNVVKKAQNYALVKRMKPQSFNLPDVGIAEDTRQAGHRASGVRLTCRMPMTIWYCGSDWKGIADVRLNRADYGTMPPFAPHDIPLANRYAHWAKTIADSTYALGLCFEQTFCRKLSNNGSSISATRV